VGLYREYFESGEYGVWFRIFTFTLTFISGLIGTAGGLLRHSLLRKVACACLSVGVFAVVFNVLFGLRTAAVVLCNGEIKEACMEPATGCGGDGPVRDWQAFLFSFTLCVLLCAMSVAIDQLLKESLHQRLQPPERMPETLHQSALDASVTHDSPGKKVKTDSIEKSELLEPVFVPVSMPRDSPQKVDAFKESEVTDLVSSKDFEGSLGRSGSIRGRGRGRGRGK